MFRKYKREYDIRKKDDLKIWEYIVDLDNRISALEKGLIETSERFNRIEKKTLISTPKDFIIMITFIILSILGANYFNNRGFFK